MNEGPAAILLLVTYSHLVVLLLLGHGILDTVAAVKFKGYVFVEVVLVLVGQLLF